MKLLFYRVDSRKRDRKENYRLNIERMLFFSFIIVFCLMVIVQAALVNPSVRTFLTSGNEFEGTPLGVEEFLYQEGEVALKVSDNMENSDLKVLVNGEEVADFSNPVISLNVKNGDVIELDGSSSEREAVVEITSNSENIKQDCVNKRVKVKSNVIKLTKISME